MIGVPTQIIIAIRFRTVYSNLTENRVQCLASLDVMHILIGHETLKLEALGAVPNCMHAPCT